MKYITLITLLFLISAQDIKCPPESKEQTVCIEIYSPVCGYTAENEVPKTYSNSCFACSEQKVNFYRSGECKQTDNSTTNSGSENSNTTTNQNGDGQTASSITLHKCSEPRAQGDDVVCPENYNKTCGLFKSTIQCIKAPCGQQYDNDCKACGDPQVDSYFYGNCDDQQPKQEQKPTSKVIECQDPRPEICTLIYTETCAFTTSPCTDSSCMVAASSDCDACSNSNYKAYYQGSCQSYTYLSNQVISQTLITDQKTNQDSTQTVNTECPTTTPLACDDSESLVCGISSAESKEIQFTNSCKACTETSIKSYYQGKCKSLSKFDLLVAVSLIIASEL